MWQTSRSASWNWQCRQQWEATCPWQPSPFTAFNYARVALKINRDARAVGLDLVARHLSDYLQMKTPFVAGPTRFSTLVHVPLIDMK
jgi:hypothetical protein